MLFYICNLTIHHNTKKTMLPISILKRALLLLIISIFSIQFSYGQSNFLPGHVTTTKGDTLQGFIDYRDWDISPKEISFREDSISNLFKEFTTQNISSFVVNNNKYISAIIKHEISSDITTNLDYSPKMKIKTDTSFIKVIFDGEKKLYKYKNSKSRKNTFYIEVNDKVQILIYKRYLVKDDERISIVENIKYKGLLSVYLSDYSKIGNKLKYTEYKENSLTKLFDNYYKSTNQSFKYKSKESKIKFEFGVSVGVINTALMFSGDDRSFLVNTQYSKSTDFIGGLSLNIVLPKSLSRLSIYNEVLYTSYVVDGSYSSDTRSYYSKIGSESIVINNLIRYSFPISASSFFINTGVSSSISISETNELESTYLVGSQNPVKNEVAIDSPRELELGLVFGLGTKFKKFSAEVRYIRGNGMSPYKLIGSKTNKYSLLINYQL